MTQQRAHWYILCHPLLGLPFRCRIDHYPRTDTVQLSPLKSGIRLLINEIERNPDFGRFSKNVPFRTLFDKLMNLIYDEINYMGLLSILELIMVLLKRHSFVILSDLNPLTGEVLESTNIKVKNTRGTIK